jgi:hypothetical protein
MGDPGSIALPASSLALPLHRGSTVALPAQTGDDPGHDIAGRATVEPLWMLAEPRWRPTKPRWMPEEAGRAPEDDDGATVDPDWVPAKPGSFQKNHDNLR